MKNRKGVLDGFRESPDRNSGYLGAVSAVLGVQARAAVAV